MNAKNSYKKPIEHFKKKLDLLKIAIIFKKLLEEL